MGSYLVKASGRCRSSCSILLSGSVCLLRAAQPVWLSAPRPASFYAGRPGCLRVVTLRLHGNPIDNRGFIRATADPGPRKRLPWDPHPSRPAPAPTATQASCFPASPPSRRAAPGSWWLQPVSLLVSICPQIVVTCLLLTLSPSYIQSVLSTVSFSCLNLSLSSLYLS